MLITLLLLSAAPKDDVRFITAKNAVPYSEVAINTRVTLHGCDGGVCDVVFDCKSPQGCERALAVNAEDLSATPATTASTARRIDTALMEALAIEADAPTLVARAALQNRHGDARTARGLAMQAVEQAVRSSGDAPRLAVVGESHVVPAVRDGESVIAICHDTLVRGRVKVRAQVAYDGWRYTVSGPCKQSAGRSSRGEIGAWVVAGLPDSELKRGSVEVLANGFSNFRLGEQVLHVEYLLRQAWIVDATTKSRTLLPRHASPIFVGDIDGDGRIDALLQEAGACSFNVAWLMLSTRSPEPSVPVTVVSATGEFGECD